MRLIHTETLRLVEFVRDADIPPYAILSHTWGRDEITFQEWQFLWLTSAKRGFRKVLSACRRAECDGLDWLWVDTGCIDKTSSAELSEAINSMFSWYAKSQICYAYLSDVPTVDKDEEIMLEEFGNSLWFTRGWTLQELLAPEQVIFYSADWMKIGHRADPFLSKRIHDATGISPWFLGNFLDLPPKTRLSPLRASAAQRMSWVSRRETTRPEDHAYCMLGLFDINMPLIYGEGTQAFMRLQEEIIKWDNDQSLFCWKWNGTVVPRNWNSFLAPHPAVFWETNSIVSKHTSTGGLSTCISIYAMTNGGISMELPV
ncbi:hypothetical protein K456DRAFT_1813696, partial [Colletotrichum gloeosporioides 23]